MSAETSPTSRALQVLELLQNQPGTTADQLAAELGVTERAARRYVGILREAEIPIISVRGAGRTAATPGVLRHRGTRHGDGRAGGQP